MNTKIAILGAGESGVGAALLAKAKGFDVLVSDSGIIQNKYKTTLNKHAIIWEESKHSTEKICNTKLVIKSPGIPNTAKIILAIKAKAIEIISEIEFASRYTTANIIGITGSNGKTTTTSLTNFILKNGGLKTIAAGNIGNSFAEEVCNENNINNYTLELSSFQLDEITDFKPNIAIITNITPDHLDRYENNFDNYVASKFRITKNQTKNDYLIYDADDSAITHYIENNKINATLLPFSITKKIKNGAYLHNNTIIITIDHKPLIMPIDTLNLQGIHNTKNAMAAATVAHLMKIRKNVIRESLEHFQGVEHRLENVLKINKVQYINDSKATNVNATYYALESMNTPTIWIVGGVDKGNDYTELFSFINEKVKTIICLGTDNKKLLDNFENMVDNIIETQSMNEAVNIAYKQAVAGDSVLLSPACASFDLFENYEDRGRQFKDAVRKL